MPNTTAVRTAQVGAAPFFAGKNKIINGDFGIWQRGTSFTATGAVYNADRFMTDTGSVSGFSASRSSFTAGTAPVAGYEGQYFLDVAGTLSNASTGYLLIQQRIEDVRTLSNQTVTLSFWAKGSASGTIGTVFIQAFGSGGSADVASTVATHSITTSWQRFTQTVTLGSMSGKTIGTGSFLGLNFVKNIGSSYPTYGTANYTGTLSIWGVQVEAGSVATPFTTATGTIQGELAACQRYFWRQSTGGPGAAFGQGTYYQSSAFYGFTQFPVEMRATPTLSAASGTDYYTISRNGGVDYVNSLTAQASTPRGSFFFNNSEASGTAGQGGIIESNNASATISWSSEL